MRGGFLRDAIETRSYYERGMNTIRTVQEMQAASSAIKGLSRRVALVPTMGALHEGHAQLMRQAREEGAAVVVSVYVNPTQFGQHEDLQQYPRDLGADEQLCNREKVDVVFAPSDEEMYPGGGGSAHAAATWVEETILSLAV